MRVITSEAPFFPHASSAKVNAAHPCSGSPNPCFPAKPSNTAAAPRRPKAKGDTVSREWVPAYIVSFRLRSDGTGTWTKGLPTCFGWTLVGPTRRVF